MHEMSIAVSLLTMAEEEARAKGCSHIIAVTVHYGQISGIMPSALQMAFSALIADGPHHGARLELIEIPLRLRCPFCGTVFDAEEAILAPCPQCGEEFGHEVIQGRELILTRIEANNDQDLPCQPKNMA